MKTCSMCGRQVKVTVACPYQRNGLETCPDCCEKCYHSEPFPCPEYEKRNRERGDTLKETKTGQAHAGGENAAKKWAEVLDLPEDQAIPCGLLAFVIMGNHLSANWRPVPEGSRHGNP